MKRHGPDVRSPLKWSLLPPILGFIVVSLDKNLIGAAKEAFEFDLRTAIVLIAVALVEGWRNWAYPLEATKESPGTLAIALTLIGCLIAVCISIGGESSHLILYLSIIFGALKFGKFASILMWRPETKI